MTRVFLHAEQPTSTRRKESFRLPACSNPSMLQKVTNEKLESPSSSSSVSLAMPTPTSSNESIIGSENLKAGADSITSYRNMNDNLFPQTFQPDGKPSPQEQMINTERYHPPYSNVASSQMGTPFLGCVNMVPIQFLSAAMNLEQPLALRSENIGYSAQYQQRNGIQQSLTVGMSTPTSAVPSVQDNISWAWIPETAVDTLQNSPTVDASVVRPPLRKWFSVPGYVNLNGCVNSPMITSTPYTFNPSSYIYPSFIPPVLNLNNKYSSGCAMPEQISCSLRQVAVQPGNNPAVGGSPKEVSKSSTYHLGKWQEENQDWGNEIDNLRVGNCDYKEYLYDGGSNLFVSWPGTVLELLGNLQKHDLQVRLICKTNDKGILNVIFENHINARRAFIMQREIQLRMIPPINSHRNWLRNPSPKFVVKFETKCRLVVKKGKAECHEIVGDLLMSNCQEKKGCLIWANQLKGHRIRVLCCEGNFMFPDGRVVNMKGGQICPDEKKSLGWISYRCRDTRELFINRRSGDKLEDYIYTE